jgi:hypothetical protein
MVKYQSISRLYIDGLSAFNVTFINLFSYIVAVKFIDEQNWEKITDQPIN